MTSTSTSTAHSSCPAGEPSADPDRARTPGPVAGAALTSCRGITTEHGDGMKIRLDHLLPRMGPVDGPVQIAAVLPMACNEAVAWQLPAHPSAVPIARTRCRDIARTWDLPKATAEAAESMACELATNAITHGAPPVCLQLGRTEDEIVVAVYDAGPAMPAPREPGACDPGDELSGWGMSMLVPALSARSSVTRVEQGGKIVIAHLACGGQVKAAAPILGRAGHEAAVSRPVPVSAALVGPRRGRHGRHVGGRHPADHSHGA